MVESPSLPSALPHRGGLASSQKSWIECRAYCQTPDMFVLSLGREFYIIPKRSLTEAEISEFQTALSARLSQAKVRTGILAVRHAVSLVLLGYIAFFFFGGTIERALWRGCPLSRTGNLAAFHVS
jgi:hypothetical protein